VAATAVMVMVMALVAAAQQPRRRSPMAVARPPLHHPLL